MQSTKGFCSFSLTLGMFVLLTFGASGVSAQGGATKSASNSRATPPSGAEIAAAARGATLAPTEAVTATILGKPFKFTPARAPAAAPKDVSHTGGVLGVLENGAAGDETGLPAGKYHIFVTQIKGQWKGFAEAGGQVVREAIRTTVAAEGQTKPGFAVKGWCVRSYLYVWNGWGFSRYGGAAVCF